MAQIHLLSYIVLNHYLFCKTMFQVLVLNPLTEFEILWLIFFRTSKLNGLRHHHLKNILLWKANCATGLHREAEDCRGQKLGSKWPENETFNHTVRVSTDTNKKSFPHI